MIGNAADRCGDSVELADYATQKCMQAITPFRGNAGDAILGAENNVVMKREVGGGHFESIDESGVPVGTHRLYWLVPVACATG